MTRTQRTLLEILAVVILGVGISAVLHALAGTEQQVWVSALVALFVAVLIQVLDHVRRRR